MTYAPRSTLNLEERLHLLLADALDLKHVELCQPDRRSADWWRYVQGPSGRAIHDSKVLQGWIAGAWKVYCEARARGETMERLTRGAERFLRLSLVEEQVLAWRRGGHLEYLRVRRAQRQR